MKTNPIRFLYSLFHLLGKRTINFFETHINRTLGEKLNPLYFLGAIPIFLLFVLLVSGVYVFIFYNMAIDSTYESLHNMMLHSTTGKFMRTLHRYAADMMMLFVILHLGKYFFESKYQKHRWLAWVTGIILLLFMLIQGITGFMLPLDSVSRYVLEKTSELLSSLKIMGDTLPRSFSAAKLMGKWIMWVILIMHLIIPLSFILLIFIHLTRIARAKIFPPKKISISILVFLAISALVFPLKVLGPADANLLPFLESMDWFYLFFARVSENADNYSYLLVGFFGAAAFLFAVPWLKKSPPVDKADLDLQHCTGCTVCSRDCPYDAIRMRPRTDGKKYKQEAFVNLDICAGCGICVGSCDFGGMNLTILKNNTIQKSVEDYYSKVEHKNHWTIIACNSHLNLLGTKEQLESEIGCHILNFPCSGTLGPTVAENIHKAGAGGILLATCPDGDCVYREGNVWLQERIQGTRKPHYIKVNENFPIHVLRFSHSETEEFRKLAKSIVREPNPAKRLFSTLANKNKLLSYIVTTVFFGAFGALFYLGAMSNIGKVELDNSKSLVRIDFFYLTSRSQCSLEDIDPKEYQKAIDRMTSTLKFDDMNPEAKKRILDYAEKNVKEKFCSRNRLSLSVKFLIDDKLIEEKLFSPPGLQGDGMVYVRLKEFITPGNHSIKIHVSEINNQIKNKEFIYENKTVLENGKVYFIDFDKNEQKLYLRVF